MATPVPTRQTSGRLTHLAGKTTEVAQTTYTTAKNVLVPEKMKPTVDNVESQVAGAAAPYVHKAQDAGASLLRAADDKVDRAVETAQRVYTDNAAYLEQQLAKQKEFHSQNLESFKTAREAYLRKVEEAVEFVRQKGVTGAARAAADEVMVRVGEAKSAVLAAPGALLLKVQQAVDKLLAFGPVNSAVEAAKPSLGAAMNQYSRLHDSLVASQQYKQAYSMAGDFAQRAQQTWVVAAAKQRLMPLAQPAVDSVMASPYYSSLVAHLQPIHAA